MKVRIIWATTIGLMTVGYMTTVKAEDSNVFKLGEVLVTAPAPDAPSTIASTLTSEDIRQFNRETVADALNLLPGVTLSNNVRNEQMISVRGYDSRQVPLFIDGIPVYVPYDGYVDFGRFVTSDLAAIQVSKGFSSVSYGPNTLGGAINLISRRPSKELEGDVRVGYGEGSSREAHANIGTNQGSWYFQAGAGYRESNGFRMSDDFKPTPLENGGRRNNSYYKDDKVSLKFGLTPNDTDEYAISYYKQNGEKGQPPTTDPLAFPDRPRYWKWPFWDKESLYFVSNTALGAHEALKVRLYADKFDNELNSYTDATYTVLKTSSGGGIPFVGSGRSIYHDKTYGGSIELESKRFNRHTLRFVTHYKNDRHEEVDANDVLGADYEDTFRSVAVEDTITLSDKLTLTLGFAHHELSPDKVLKPGQAYTLPSKQTANDPQAALFYDLNPAVRLYASVAQKTRLPTLKDRYSQRLGSYIENPGLQAEEAVNYEIGYRGSPWAGANAEVAVFYNDIEDKIQAVNLGAGCTPCQMQNVGEVRVRGLEVSLQTPLNSRLDVGGNFTRMDLDNRSDPDIRITSIPETKLILHAVWRPVEQVKLIALMEQNGGRWASDTVKLDRFTIFNLKGVWEPREGLFAEIGVNNLSDRNYELHDGFPNPGRMWYTNLSYVF